MRHMDVVLRIGPAHIERVFGAFRADHAEIGEKLFGLVEARRLQSPIGDIGYLDVGHGRLPIRNLLARSIARTCGIAKGLERIPPRLAGRSGIEPLPMGSLRALACWNYAGLVQVRPIVLVLDVAV